MRKITSKHKEEKKTRRKQLFVGGILMFVIILSTFGYSFFYSEKSSESKIVYNGVEFIEKGEFWTAGIGNLQFSFRYNPQETEDLGNEWNITKDASDYYNLPLYIYSENVRAESEIYQNLDQIILRRQYACIGEEKCGESIPVKTCEDNFIIIKEAEESGIEQKENCIFIQGKEEDLARLTDEFLFKIFGIQ